jgi:hypothetical protein
MLKRSSEQAQFFVGSKFITSLNKVRDLGKQDEICSLTIAFSASQTISYNQIQVNLICWLVIREKLPSYGDPCSLHNRSEIAQARARNNSLIAN